MMKKLPYPFLVTVTMSMMKIETNTIVSTQMTKQLSRPSSIDLREKMAMEESK